MPAEPPPPSVNPTAAQLARGDTPDSHATAQWLARYLDDWLRIPGTNARIGLDPILSLFPGVGDVAVSSAGGLILLDALRSGVGLAVLLRMSLNLGFNFVLGLIPAGGAVLSALFKSNSRNLALLQAWQAGQRDKVRRSTLRYFLGLGMIFGLFASLIVIGWLFYSWLLYTFFKTILPAGWL